MRTCSSSNLPVVSPPNPSTSNPKRRNPRRSKQPFILEESPVDTMTDQRTMAELLRAPTEGYAEAIVVPPILAEQFELKHILINMMTSDQFFGLEKDNPHVHIHWFNKITSTIKYKDVPNSAIKLMLFSFSLAGAARRWLEKEPPQIAKLTHAVNQQTNVVTTAMTTILKQFQATPPPASVKVVEEICVTCGGAHLYYQCLAAGGNTFLKLRDNIQGYVAAAAVNYNQGNLVYRPPGSGSLPSNTVANPKGELKAITTRSGIVLDEPTVPTPPPFINPEVDERVEETLTNQDLFEYTIKGGTTTHGPNSLTYDSRLSLANYPSDQSGSQFISSPYIESLSRLSPLLNDPFRMVPTFPCRETTPEITRLLPSTFNPRLDFSLARDPRLVVVVGPSTLDSRLGLGASTRDPRLDVGPSFDHRLGLRQSALDPRLGESDREEVPETNFEEVPDKSIFKGNSVRQNDVHSEDPFGIYKEDGVCVGQHVHEQVEVSKDTHESTCSGHFKKSEVPRKGGSILELIDDLANVGQTMGYDMTGCIKNMEEIIELQGVDEIHR
nr:reverse transcriptase domain-containing protein [Tanacetum cinerariifolium]